MNPIPDHLTEVEVVSVADGQPVPPAALAHLEACEDCSARVADHALMAHAVHVDLRALAIAEPSPATEPVRSPRPLRPSPIKPLLIGSLVAVAASLPLMSSATRTLVAFASGSKVHADALSAAMRSLLSTLQRPAWSLGTTATLVLVGALAAILATRASQRASLQDPNREGAHQ